MGFKLISIFISLSLSGSSFKDFNQKTYLPLLDQSADTEADRGA